MLYSKRVPKKKHLTDPVEIIPFPEQSVEPALPKVLTVKSSKETITSYVKEEPKVLIVPSGQLNTSNISIKRSMEPSKNASSREELSNQILQNEKFSVDQVKMAWRQYAHEVKSKGLGTFYNAMIKRDPKIKDEVCFTMEVDNQVQIDYITPHIAELVQFLRQELKNYQITVDFFLTEDKDSEMKFLSGKDRFASMAKKNPNLHSFKTIFNLEIEF